MQNITAKNLLEWEFVHLSDSTHSIDYYYAEFTSKLGIQVSIEGDIIEVDVCLPSSIPRNSKSVQMPGIKSMEDLFQLAKFMGFEEDIK